MSDYQAIVIGSGAGGLSSALYLAKKGVSVLLLEAMPSFGGYLNPFSRKQYKFDTGLHYLGELGKGEPFWNLLNTIGIADKIQFIELDPECFDRYIFGDYEFCLCKGKERFKDNLVKSFPKEERGITMFLDVSDKIAKAVKSSTSMGPGLIAMIGFLLKHPVMLKYSRAPYQKLLDEVTSDKRLQAVLAGYSGTYGLPPERASIIISMLVLNHYLAGGYYPQGGSGAFRDAFLNALLDNGAEMKRNTSALRIDKKESEFSVKTGSDETYTAQLVISDVDPIITLGKLVNPQIVPSKIQKKVQQLRPSLGTFNAFVGTNLDLPSLGITDANIHYHDNFNVNRIYQAISSPSLQENVPYYFITSPSVKDPQGGHAPLGRHTIEIFTGMNYSVFEKWRDSPSMKHGDEYEELKQKIGKRLVKAAEKFIPNLSENLDYVEYSTPLSNEYWVKAIKGGIYGPEQTPDQMGQGRFSTFTAGIEGLFLVGAGTLGGGIMPCVQSGILAGQKAESLL